MKRVGIVSCYFKHNYGSMLQAYATKKFLDKNNIPNETINVKNLLDFKKGKRKYYLKQLFNFSFIKSKFGMIKFVFDKKINKKLNRNISIRTKKYNEFKKEFNLSRACTTYKDLEKLSIERYSDVIVGSDQLWLPVNVVSDYYTLNWVSESINKISYATSFGISKIPTKYNELYKRFLNRINHLSVREQDGIHIIKDITDRDAKIVLDPTLLLTKDEWEKESVKDKIIDEKYILCYFLGSNKKHREYVEKIKKKTGYKIVSLNHADEYVKYSDVFADITPYDIGPREWINLVKNAEIVCTDSFHCTVFSILFNKKFFDFRRYNSKTTGSTNSRIDSLLNLAGISTQRILNCTEDVNEVLNYKIDYEKVNENINILRKDSQEWLLNSIEWKEDGVRHIEITSKEDCSGCTACASRCPKDAISMVRDEEGFLYPKVDKEKCIECGLCKKVCPILNKKSKKEFKQKGYIFQYNDNKIRKQSTSGGAFTAIADYVIEHNGIVFGVGFDENYKVKHQEVRTKEKLEKFRNSKYVQSDPNTTFKSVEKYLKEKRLVCYSGTSCQIEGLLSFLGKEYENLITVDVICRAVPSPLLWEKYLAFKSNNEKINRIYFREKLFGYKYSNLTMYNKSNKLFYNNGVDTDPYLRAFFSNIASRPSCYNCNFKEQLHKADITIWDCFEVEKFDKSFDDDIGTTRILLNSEKAIKIFNEIKDKHHVKEINVDNLVSNFHQMFNSIKYNSKRSEFFIDLNDKKIEEVMKKYFPNKLKNKLEKNGRIILMKMGIYKPLLKLGKKIRKRD